jgi:hypothetical protein
MLRHERRTMSRWLGYQPYIHFCVSYGEKAKVYVISKSGELINTFMSTEFDIELTKSINCIIIIRESRSRNVLHLFEVIEKYYGLDVIERYSIESKKVIYEMLKAYNLAYWLCAGAWSDRGSTPRRRLGAGPRLVGPAQGGNNAQGVRAEMGE